MGRWRSRIAAVAAAVVGVATVALVAPPTPTATASPTAHGMRLIDTTAGPVGAPGETALRAMHGALPADARQLAAAKARPTRTTAVPTAASLEPQTTAATASPAWVGVYDPSATPADASGAVSPSNYVELVNARFAIYDRAGTKQGNGTLDDLAGAPHGARTFDPQVIWDPSTERFYYSATMAVNANDNRIAVGFSKTATPAGAADFCHYTVPYGANVPDFPRLGDSADFFIVGVNDYDAGSQFVGADIIAIGKPTAGATCPAASDLALGARQGAQNKDGTTAFTPIPVNEIDDRPVGYVLATPAAATGRRFITVITVKTNSDGSPNISATGAPITVPAFGIPANAAQEGAAQLLDTLDGRLTQAVGAIDPQHGGKFAVWTQHTVDGGGGARVRWYEFDPAAKTTFQTGVVASNSKFFYNAAIAPDRIVNGTTKQFGGDMVMTVTSSSTSEVPTIRTVTKIGTAAMSAPVLVRRSAGPSIDFECPTAGDLCPWGQYASATPDPGASTSGTAGGVWLTSMFASADTSTAHANWRTFDYAVDL